MKGKNFRIILVFLVLVCVMITFASCASKESLPDTSESSTGKEEATNVDISSETKVSLSLDERKELAEYYFIMKYVDSFRGAGGKFYAVDWDNTRYKATVKQVFDNKYEISATVAVYDKYENLLGVNEKLKGELWMEEDGTFDKVYFKNQTDYDWE